MQRSLILIISLMLIYNLSYAIQVSGDVSGTWTLADNPYEVVGDLRVPPGDTLIIEAGCYIEFQGYYKFIIDTSATLQVIGDAVDSVVFSASNTNQGWYGLRFLNAGDNCRLSFCRIQWGKISAPEPQEPFPDGAGVYIDRTDMDITNCSFRNNSTIAGRGGGAYIQNSSVFIYNASFEDNFSGKGGAAIACDSSEIEIDSCIIRANVTFYSTGGEWGGAMTIEHSTLRLARCRVVDNFDYNFGGGALINYCDVLITGNIISGNITSNVGGGLLVWNSVGAISYNCFFENSSNVGYGGGLAVGDSRLYISSNTIYNNYALTHGGGISVEFNDDDSLANCIIFANAAGQREPNISMVTGDSSHIMYSCIEGGWPGEGNIDADPLFVNPEAGDFHLRWDNFPIDDSTKSPCIDAGAPWSPLDPDSTRADMGALPFYQLVGINDNFPKLPKKTTLLQNYPNPFNGSTTISFSLPQASQVKLDIYDILGRKVDTIFDGTRPAGKHSVIWNADGFASGMYFYSLTAGKFRQCQRMILIK